MPRVHPAALALAALVGACGPSTSTGGAPPAPISAARASAHWTATLTPVGASSVRGTVTAATMGDRQTVQIQIAGAAPSSIYPWHIHSGSCADGMGAIVGPPAQYTALGTGSDGTAALTTDLAITLNSNQRYHVNVHASPSDMGTIVACGDLTTHEI